MPGEADRPRHSRARAPSAEGQAGGHAGTGGVSGVAGAEIRFETTRWGEVGLSFEKSLSEIKSGG